MVADKLIRSTLAPACFLRAGSAIVVAFFTRLERYVARLIIAALSAALLGGCGGGGGSDNGSTPEPIITAAFEPKEAQASVFANQKAYSNTYNVPEYMYATLDVDGIDPTKVFPVITSDKSMFSDLIIDVSNRTRKLMISALPASQTTAGTYTGKLTVTLYKDAAKTKAYTLSNGGIFPYTIKVDPELVITVKIDGVVQARRVSSSNAPVLSLNGNTIYWNGASPEAAFRLKPGQIVELKSSIPVTWHGPHSWYPYGDMWLAAEETETTLRQVTMPLNNIPSMSGTPFIAMPKSGSQQWGAGFTVDVFP
jgi:hypothetical protein